MCETQGRSLTWRGTELWHLSRDPRVLLLTVCQVGTVQSGLKTGVSALWLQVWEGTEPGKLCLPPACCPGWERNAQAQPVPCTLSQIHSRRHPCFLSLSPASAFKIISKFFWWSVCPWEQPPRTWNLKRAHKMLRMFDYKVKCNGCAG